MGLSIETTLAGEPTEAQAAPSAPPRPARRRADAAGWAAGWLAVLLLAAWLQRLTPGWLPAAAAAAAAWALLARSVRRPWRIAGVLAMGLAIALAARTQYQLWRVATDWGEVRFSLEVRAGERVHQGLDRIF